MNEREWWIELDARIKIADFDGFKDIKLTCDEAKEIIELLKKLDKIEDIILHE